MSGGRGSRPASRRAGDTSAAACPELSDPLPAPHFVSSTSGALRGGERRGESRRPSAKPHRCKGANARGVAGIHARCGAPPYVDGAPPNVGLREPAVAAVDAGRRMRRPYEGGLSIRRGEACLALFRQAQSLMQGDACVARTKGGSASVGARHASPSFGKRRRRCRATHASPLRRGWQAPPSGAALTRPSRFTPAWRW